MNKLDVFNSELKLIKDKYEEQKTEPTLSIFSLPANSQLLSDFTKEVDSAFKKAVENNPELEDELITISSDYITDMTHLITGDEN